jgi:putative peptidoglycan lipid II flippase
MGFVRDMLIANFFGVSGATDAFFVAFKIPNFLRRLFAEGAFAHAFVPVLADFQRNAGHADLKSFVDKTAGTLAGWLGILTLLGVVAAPVLIMLFAPGFLDDGEQFDLAAMLLQITFPYLLFIALTAFAGSILNVYGKFAVPAITPVFLNLCMIAAAIWISPLFEQPIVALAWSVFIAGVVQLLFQWPALAGLGLVPRFRWGWQDSGVRRVIKLMLPAVFGASVVQVNQLVATLVASFLASGSVSWLYYSDRLVEFPSGLLGAAVSTVILPSLSKSHAAEDTEDFSKSLNWGIRLILLIALPATLGLVLLAQPLMYTLFQYNEFAAGDVVMASRSLMAFAAGLFGIVLIKVLVAGFTSRLDNKTPVRFGLYAVLSNVLFSVVLVVPLAHAGVALAASLSAYLNAGLLLLTLLKRNIYRPGPGWGLFGLRVVFATAVMGGFLLYADDAQGWLAWSALERGTHLALLIAGAILVYVFGLIVSGLRRRHLYLH